MADYMSINSIKSKPVKRIITGKEEIDWLYGYTKDGKDYEWGMPIGKISLWSGEKGVGKSRATIELSRHLISKYGECGVFKILYFPLEEEIDHFASLVQKSGTKLSDFYYISNESSLDKQLKIINKIHAMQMVIFIDSINMVDEYKSCSDSRIREVIEAYRKIAVESNSHIVLISMLNKEGDTKGSTTLPHLVDIEFYVERTQRAINDSGDFEVRVGNKHRFGRTGDNFYSVWKHFEDKADIISTNRTKDDIWQMSHGLPIIRPTLTEFLKDLQEHPEKRKEISLNDVDKMIESGDIIMDEREPEPVLSFWDKLKTGIDNWF